MIESRAVIWFKRKKDSIWKCADLIYNYLIWFAVTWFDLRFEQITDWIDTNCSKFVELYIIKEYQPTTNRYFVRIKLNYVYTMWICCVFAWQDWNGFIPVAHLSSNFNLKLNVICDLPITALQAHKSVPSLPRIDNGGTEWTCVYKQ